MELVKAPEALQVLPQLIFGLGQKKKKITALLTEKSSEHEGTQEPIIDLDTIAKAQATLLRTACVHIAHTCTKIKTLSTCSQRKVQHITACHAKH